jgi:hypothetical protein
MIGVIFRILIVLTPFLFQAFGAEWVRGGFGTNELVYGSKGGLLFALPPSGFRTQEPRGLIRLGYPVLTNGGYDLVNFIAIEPVVNGRKAFSELEKSDLDGVRGKRLWVISETADEQKLAVRIGVERFANGAEVELSVEQHVSRPDEIAITTREIANSAKMEFCILTATMGNMIRARELWLKDTMVTARQLYPDYKDVHFAPHRVFASEQLLRLTDGSAMAAITPDEDDPAATIPATRAPFWHYQGGRVTQYWKHPGPDHSGLAVVVNARHTYYGSRREIPGGNSFENFEMRRPFTNAQQFIFGITKKTPEELGFQR